MVKLGKFDQLPNNGETLGCGKWKIIPRALFSLKMKGKTHGNKTTTGVGFPQIKKIVVEREKEEILNQYAGENQRSVLQR